MDDRLRRAAEEGNTNALYACIREDPNVLRRIHEAEFVDTPIHVAAARGHADFVIAIMYLKPSFARKLNQDVDSHIHLALQNGHTTTVLRILQANRDLIRIKGKEGYTVLHHVVENGNLELLAQFLKDCPTCIDDVTIQNETALHIAVKNNRFEALEILVRWLQRSHLYCKVSRIHLLNSEDRDGNTVLHIAASHIQPQIIRLLLECKVNTKAINMNGLTALDILESQMINTQNGDIEMGLNILRSAGGFSRRNVPLHKRLRSKITLGEQLLTGLMNMSAERINVFLVVLALFLTAAFQSVQSPPGGVWQGDAISSANSNSTDVNVVGKSKIDPLIFQVFSSINGMLLGLTSILTIVLLQLTGSGGVIMIPVEILLSLFFCCILVADFVISPKSTDPSVMRGKGFFISLLIFLFFFTLAFWELLRRFLNRLALRLQIFVSSFREI